MKAKQGRLGKATGIDTLGHGQICAVDLWVTLPKRPGMFF